MLSRADRASRGRQFGPRAAGLFWARLGSHVSRQPLGRLVRDGLAGLPCSWLSSPRDPSERVPRAAVPEGKSGPARFPDA